MNLLTDLIKKLKPTSSDTDSCVPDNPEVIEHACKQIERMGTEATKLQGVVKDTGRNTQGLTLEEALKLLVEVLQDDS